MIEQLSLDLLRRPRAGTPKEKCFTEFFKSGADAAITLGVSLGVKSQSVERWISDWQKYTVQS
jgi:hypothetical protein